MAENSQHAAQWLPAARTGSREALGQVLQGCREYLLLLANQELAPELRAKGGASDLVQQTFLEAQLGFARFHGESEAELLAWLRRLLLNNLADFSRSYRRTGKRHADREVPLQADSSTEGAAAGLTADTPSPSGQAVAHEQDEALERAMARLPEDYRRVLIWRYQEERSFEEIGKQLQRTPNAARKLWLRAVERLRQDLEAPP
jgi:RNA polymerase sigma-70 factor (ECF subfamily)